MPSIMPVDRNGPTPTSNSVEMSVFRTQLGWIALAMRRASLVRLVFGYPNVRTAKAALELAAGTEWSGFEARFDASNSSDGTLIAMLKGRLVAYADGMADAFTDVPVWRERWTPFQRRVLDCCRRIPFGQTRSYAALATAAGSPAAARAVGRTMATNPIPLVIPCHRVVGSAGDLRGFSAVGGLDTKRQLLNLERAANLAPACHAPTHHAPARHAPIA